MRDITFNNGQYQTKAMGLAIDDNTHTAYYVSMAAPQTALESVKASLVTRKGTTARGWHSSGFRLMTPTVSVKRAMANTPENHYLIKSLQPGLVLIDDPTAANLGYYDRLDRENTHREQILLQLTRAINQVTKVPWPYEWTQSLLERKPYNAWNKLTCYGDALVAYLVNPNYRWIEYAQEQLKNYSLYIPEQPLIQRVQEIQAAAFLPA